MSAIFHDVHSRQPDRHKSAQVWGSNFTELLYADDTALISKSAHALETLLHDLQIVASSYGLYLIKKKCVHIRLNAISPIKYLDQSEVPTEADTIYLGANINNRANVDREISRRISASVIIWKRLEFLWKHSVCDIPTKINLYNAVIRAKLVYGLHTVRLLPHQCTRIDAFQLRGLRQILGISTTFAQQVLGQPRTHSNEYVLHRLIQLFRIRMSLDVKNNANIFIPPKTGDLGL